MHFKKALILTLMVSIVFLFQQCSKKDTATVTTTDTVISPKLPASPFNYINTYPAFIQASLNVNDNTPADNAITNDGATLGRVLFYDKHLSKNNTVSCGSCHKPDASFSDNAIE
jgi:cytochrome c peroxidase